MRRSRVLATATLISAALCGSASAEILPDNWEITPILHGGHTLEEYVTWGKEGIDKYGWSYTISVGMTTQDAAVGYLARVLRVNAGAIPAPSGTDPDLGSTANAVLSLVAAGTARPQVRAAMAVLESHARSFVVSRGRVLPGAAALVVLAEHATSGDPHDVDGLDLVRRIGGSITR